MKLLSLLHRWSGGLIGLILALIGLSGAILVWEDAWIGVPGIRDPLIEKVEQLTAVSEDAIAEGATRITYASEDVGLHHAAGPGGSGTYIRQDGSVVDRWSSHWSRPELWLFEFHHYLFAGKTGERVAGIMGLFGLFFSVSGAILWWRSRRTFEWRLWPRQMQPGPIVRHHRDLGIVTLPVLLISLITGLGMIYGDVTRALLGATEQAVPVSAPTPARPAIATMLETSKSRYPEAKIRRLSAPSEGTGVYSVRLRQDGEWTPNGRTTLYFDARGRLLKDVNALESSRGDRLYEKFYPVHAAKTGSTLWKVVMTFSGLSLFVLGALAIYAFWLRQWRRNAFSGSRFFVKVKDRSPVERYPTSL